MAAPLVPAKFYPIVPDANWVGRIAPLGVKTIQLRMKDLPDAVMRASLKASLDIARRHDCQLIVNDFWRLAIDVGAPFIHLGQEDLAAADLKAIKRAGLRFGVSTHDETELEAALEAKADYVALGPVYPTTLKAMRFDACGLSPIRRWKQRIGSIPLVVIGGMTLERAIGAIAAGADSVAVVTDFLTNSDPERRIRQWVAWAGEIG